MMAAPPELDENIRKYEEIGTHPAANHNAISAALAFHRAIGAERKIARLRWLRDRWAKRLLAENDRVRVLTPLDSPYSGAIGFFTVTGMDMAKLNAWLLEKHHIVNTLITHPEFTGLRITPNVYTTPDEVDVFAEKVLEAIRKGMARRLGARENARRDRYESPISRCSFPNPNPNPGVDYRRPDPSCLPRVERAS
jgi:selenocysteine lyase/cysteine desulfurase